MDNNKSVRLRPDFLLEQLDNEYTVYHPTLTISLYLNESAAVIWELCREERRIGEIIDILRQAYPESNAHIEDDVVGLVEQLVSHGVADLVD